MKKGLLFIALLTVSVLSNALGAQDYWKATVKKSGSVIVENKKELTRFKLFELDVTVLKNILTNTPKRNGGLKSDVIVSFPDADGIMNRYTVLENSNMDPELEAKYPAIKSYVGKGIEDPRALIYFSVSPLGLQTMLIRPDRPAEFIEPYTTDRSSYSVHQNQFRKLHYNG